MAQTDEHWMQEALALAQQAQQLGDVPVGAVVVRDDEVVATSYNRREAEQDPTAHAEVNVLRGAAQTLGRWRLHDCTLYVTLEPCPMCAGALVNARVKRLVFGATDPRAGAAGSVYDIVADQRLNHRLEVTGGVLDTPCAALLSDFFAKKRTQSGFR